MARSRELRVQIVGDTSDFNRALDSSSRKVRSAEGDIDRFSKRSSRSLSALKPAAVAAAAGFAALSTAIGVKAVKGAVDLEEQMNKTRTVFRGSEKDMLRWSQTTANALGISRREALAAAGTFGNMLVPMGVARDRAADMSKGLVTLAADLASFNNASPVDTLDAIRSALAGETEPMRRFGADLRVAALEQFALKKGLDQTYQSMSGTQRATLVYKKILSDTKDAQGDFGRTSGSLANQQRILRARFDDVTARLGTKLLPVLTDVAGWMLKFIRQMETGKGAGGNFARNLSNVADNISKVVGWVKRAITNVDNWGDATRQNVINVWRNVSRVFGNVMAGVFRGFEKLFDLGSKIPGKVGDKFDDAQRSARRAADSVDKLGERVRGLPSKKSIKIQVATLLDDFNQGKVPELFPMGSGRPTTGDLTSGLDDAVKRQAKDYFEKNATQFGPLPFLGGLGSKSPAGLAAIEAIGRKFGLVTTSGYRPGDDGWHGQNRARDISGSTSAMLAFAQYLARNFGSKLVELIHTPLGFSIDNYRRTAPFAQADHYDHVHVAMQRGGKLPGNRTGDRVPAMLEEGEFVVNRKAASAFGPTLERMNSMVSRFQGGGWARTPINVAADAARKAGLKGRALVNMVAIAGRESGWNPRVANYTYPDHSIGLWQINQLAHKGRYGSDQALMNPYTNAKAMAALYASSGMQPWVGLSYGNASQYLDEARRAVLATKGGGGSRGGGGGGGGGAPSGIVWEDDRKDLNKHQRRLLGDRVGQHDAWDLPKNFTGTKFFEDGSGIKVEKGKVVAIANDSAEGRKRWRTRPRRGDVTTQDIKTDAWQRKVDRFDDDSDKAPGAKERQALLGLGVLKGHRISVINTRLRQINRALRGKLRPARRRRLLAEKAELLGERGQLKQDRRDLAERFNYKPEADTDSGSGGDPNQPLIDALAASAEAARQHAEELKSLKEEVKRQNNIASSTVAIGLREAQRAMADMISGQIAGYAGQRARAAGDGIVGARY